MVKTLREIWREYGMGNFVVYSKDKLSDREHGMRILGRRSTPPFRHHFFSRTIITAIQKV
jgi:hypothetical protein